jgi:DNA-binding FadR family transcriptional regulator
VSRTVVREAFARLAARGLLESRRGSGAYVPAAARYRAFQVTPEEMQEVEDVIKLLEIRMALETEMAALAAERRTQADIATLRECLDRMAEGGDVEASVDADAAFHAAIARATQNDYYSRFMDFLGIRLVPRRAVYLRDQSDVAHRSYAKAIQRDHEGSSPPSRRVTRLPRAARAPPYAKEPGTPPPDEGRSGGRSAGLISLPAIVVIQLLPWR